MGLLQLEVLQVQENSNSTSPYYYTMFEDPYAELTYQYYWGKYVFLIENNTISKLSSLGSKFQIASPKEV